MKPKRKMGIKVIVKRKRQTLKQSIKKAQETVLNMLEKREALKLSEEKRK